MSDFNTVKDYVLELGFAISKEIPDEEIVIVNDEERGIQSLVIDCEDTVLVVEQLILKLDSAAPTVTYKRLLQMNRDLVLEHLYSTRKGIPCCIEIPWPSRIWI